MPASWASSPPQVGAVRGSEGTGGLLAPPLPRADPWPLPLFGDQAMALLAPSSGRVGWAGWAVVSCAGCLPGPQCPLCLGFLPVLVHCAPPTVPRGGGEGTGRDWAASFGGTSLPGHDWHWRKGADGGDHRLVRPMQLALQPPEGPRPRPGKVRARSFRVWGLGLPDVTLGHRWGWAGNSQQTRLICMVSFGRRWGATARNLDQGKPLTPAPGLEVPTDAP